MALSISKPRPRSRRSGRTTGRHLHPPHPFIFVPCATARCAFLASCLLWGGGQGGGTPPTGEGALGGGGRGSTFPLGAIIPSHRRNSRWWPAPENNKPAHAAGV